MRSSREAIKGVFKDPEIGGAALKYFRELSKDFKKNHSDIESDNIYKTMAEYEIDDRTPKKWHDFKERMSDVKDLLKENTRDFTKNDHFRERVVGKTEAKTKQGFALFAASSVAAAGGVSAGLALPVGIVVAAVNATAATNITVLNIKLQNSTKEKKENSEKVTKINPEKRVRANSKDISNGYRSEMEFYQEHGLKYKDILYEKMTGEGSKNYKLAVNKKAGVERIGIEVGGDQSVVSNLTDNNRYKNKKKTKPKGEENNKTSKKKQKGNKEEELDYKDVSEEDMKELDKWKKKWKNDKENNPDGTKSFVAKFKKQNAQSNETKISR